MNTRPDSDSLIDILFSDMEKIDSVKDLTQQIHELKAQLRDSRRGQE